MNELCEYIFPPVDDGLLEHRKDDDGNEIEPNFYMPIIPMMLVNGSEGIGTGFSSTIPAYNPNDVIANIRNLLNNREIEEMTPWFRDFKGKIEKIPDEKFKYKTVGVYSRLDDVRVKITELPVGSNRCKSFSAYKEFLQDLVVGKKKKEKKDKDSTGSDGNDDAREASSIPNETGSKKRKSASSKVGFPKQFLKCEPETNNSDDYCNYIITFEDKAVLDRMLAENVFESKLNLCSTISTSNMYLFDENDTISKYVKFCIIFKKLTF